MIVKELIEELKKFDETLQVGSADSYGDLLEIYELEEKTSHYYDENHNISERKWVRLYTQ